jgi:hypothetical protein
MYGYDLHHIRSAELIRRAEHERLVREAVRARRAERRSAESREAETHTSRFRRHRVPRTA